MYVSIYHNCLTFYYFNIALCAGNFQLLIGLLEMFKSSCGIRLN